MRPVASAHLFMEGSAFRPLMKAPGLLTATLALAGGTGACAHAQHTDDEFGKGVPPDSLLAKVKFDMPMAEVEALLGPPNGTNTYIGGKAFNPFNYGGDSGAMFETHYKGLGRVVYN